MTFDPYSAWLGLPPGPRPPDPYTLLGVPKFERDPSRVAAAAAERVRVINRKAPFDRGDEMREVLDEISSAERLLRDPAQRRQVELEVRASEKQRQPPEVRHEQQPALRVPPRRSAEKPARKEVPEAVRWPSRVVVLAGACGSAALLLLVAWLAWPSPERGGNRVAVAPARNTAPTGEKGPPQRLSPPRPPVEAAKPIAPAVVLTEEVLPTDGRDLESAVRPYAFAAGAVAPVEARKPIFSSAAEYRLPRFASDADREAYGRHLRDLLYEAFTLKGDAAALAGHFRQADALAPADPFAEYAAALAYWKRLRFEEADAHLSAALGPDAEPFRPARRASIRLHLSRNRRAEALKEAVAFAEALSNGGSTEAELNSLSVRWLGRLMAALESPWLPNAAPQKDLAEADAAIRAALGPDSVGAYEAGRRSLREDYASRAAAVEAEIADLSLDHEERRAETLDKIAGDRDAAEDEREKVTRTAAEWKTWLDEQTKGIDEELKKLETAHQQLTVQAEAASATYLTLSQEITNRQVQAELSTRGSSVILPSSGMTQLVVASNQALADLKLLNGRIAEVRGQAQVLLAKRQGIVGRYESETKTLTAKTDSLRKWEGILKRRADETGASEATDTPAAKALRRRLRDFDTYVPFDLDAERDAVLQALRDDPAP